MSELRYTLTESQLMEFCSRFIGSGLPTRKLLEGITPDPEPSGEMAEKIKDWISYYKDDNIPVPLASMLHGLTIDGLARRLANFLTAEVTRQVEGRTKVLREALETLDKGFYCHNLTIRGAQSIIRKALYNKGEE